MFEYNTTKNTITDEQTGSKWAKVCEDCAMECEKHDMDHCQQCAKVCRVFKNM
jgi:hypothetical protein